jgi:transposase
MSNFESPPAEPGVYPLLIKVHWDGILNQFKSKINNGVLEGINSLIQAAKAGARGYRKNDYLITVIYLITSNLHFNLPS